MKRPNLKSNPILQGTVLAVLILGALMWSYTLLAHSQKLALLESTNAHRAANLATQIKDLQHQPALVQDQELQQPELARKIEAALKTAGVALSMLERVTPETAHRIGDTDYREMPTNVLLRQMSLRQLVSFLYHLTTAPPEGGGESPGASLAVKTIRLSAPREPQASDKWRVEVTLTYLIYTPSQNAIRLNTGDRP